MSGHSSLVFPALQAPSSLPSNSPTKSAMNINISLCGGNAGSASSGSGGMRSSTSNSKFAAALHLPGCKSPRQPGLMPPHPPSNRNKSLMRNPDALNQGGGNSSDDDNSSIQQVLAEVASSPSLGCIEFVDKSQARSTETEVPDLSLASSDSSEEEAMGLKPRPEDDMPAIESSIPSVTMNRPPSTIGRISPHLHLDLSCVGAGSAIKRCRSDSEVTLSSLEDERDYQNRKAGSSSRQPRTQTGGSSQQQQQHQARPSIEPPPWAVEAKGEARLEPVCESLGVQSSVDLTAKACFRVGRSPQSDVQLLHATSSRRHALLFHHPNGSCYVVDCGSAHGTYVNGIRVKSAVVHPSGPGASSASNGMVIPHRVRRGALIRFGGLGAPCFVLKSFAVGFDALVKELGLKDSEASEYSSGTLLSGVNQSLASEVTKRLLGGALPNANAKAKADADADADVITETSTEEEKATDKTPSTEEAKNRESTAAMLQINTRLNALGGTSSLSPESRRLARNATARLLGTVASRAQRDGNDISTIRSPVRLGKHCRDFESCPRSLHDKLGCDAGVGSGRPSKRMRLSAETSVSPAKSPPKPPVLVSPVTIRQNIFASPVPSAKRHPAGSGVSALTETPSVRPILSLPLSLDRGVSGTSNNGGESGASTPPLRKIRNLTRRVKFNDQTETCYAPSVTPDEISLRGSFDEEDSAAAITEESNELQLHVPKTPRGN